MITPIVDKPQNEIEFKVGVRSLSKEELISQFGKLVQTERKITEQVLEHIVEIDRRKIYLEKAYPSLFEYLVKGYGYSPSSAMRRIESARLLKEIPEVSEKLKSGAINLSQLAKVQQTVRAVQKTSHLKICTQQKKELLNLIEFKTQAKTELILAQKFDLPPTHLEKEKVHRNESITLTMTFSKEQMAILEKAQNLMGHMVSGQKWAELFTHLAEKEINRRSPKVEIKKIMNQNGQTKIEKHTDVTKQKNQSPRLEVRPKHISLKTRKEALNPDTACCQFRDPATNKTCGSLKFLQIDHIQPRWAGGLNDPSNLQVLCAQHNRYSYKTQSGLLP